MKLAFLIAASLFSQPNPGTLCVSLSQLHSQCTIICNKNGEKWKGDVHINFMENLVYCECEKKKVIRKNNEQPK
jgi:hypothetical protein